jgi:hypothetical protein
LCHATLDSSFLTKTYFFQKNKKSKKVKNKMCQFSTFFRPDGNLRQLSQRRPAPARLDRVEEGQRQQVPPGIDFMRISISDKNLRTKNFRTKS